MKDTKCAYAHLVMTQGNGQALRQSKDIVEHKLFKYDKSLIKGIVQ